MFSIQRRQRILDEVRTSGAVTVTALAAQFAVGELTIRRDLTALADRGLITRVHGGATIRSELDASTALRPASDESRYRIGMIVPTLSFYWPAVITGARAAASDLRVELVLRGASYDAADQRRQIRALADSGTVHGLICAPETASPDGAALLSWLDTLSIPVVLAERRAPRALPLERLEWVCTDHDFGAGLAVHHLHARGHRNIGLVLPPSSPTSTALREGWLRVREELGIADGVSFERQLDTSGSTPGEQKLSDLMSECREAGVTALLVHSDDQAMQLVHHCFDNGIRVPEDLAIVAYDDEIASNGQPPITALRPPKADVGRLAVEVLVARLEAGGERPVQRTMLLPALIERAST
jgi:DNA-binding LacI/PurR family transcriptional regulator